MALKNYLSRLYRDFPSDFNLHNSLDPDSDSKELYEDLTNIFFSRKSLGDIDCISAEVKVQQYGTAPEYYTIFIDNDDILLSPDYIGPSKYWAHEAHLSDNEIMDFLMISREIGGHIVFPRGTRPAPTVNQARGGKKGYFDRFDVTLFAIKSWFECRRETRLSEAIEGSKKWFNRFRDFNHFISFFKLEMFLTPDGEVLDLVNSDLVQGKAVVLTTEQISIPQEHDEYRRFVENSNLLIKKRTKLLVYGTESLSSN